jgi:hypothetical protein
MILNTKSSKNLLKKLSAEEIKMMRKIKAGVTDVSMGHYHTVEMDENGNGVTTYASHMSNHAHKVIGGVVIRGRRPLSRNHNDGCSNS